MKTQFWQYIFPPLPPIAMLLTVGFGVLLNHYFSFPFTLGSPYWAVFPLTLAIGLLVAAKWAFHRHHTTVDPIKEPSALVTTGIYAYTRNPMYLALVLLIVSAGFYFNSLWCWGLVPAYMTYLSMTFIFSEEQRLAAHWPDAFTEYRAHVRRWI
ncbi:hypothetical protein BZJ19_05565 [Salinivibrio proteolyticus]|uniref:methyltransferase family protein n=1 Tax=Salinivibrio proteolyticus TaxID=334715 RepID=UPI000988DB21|nr:isoprenylcysteine carboxylmethyltransferase family protein [Salinivibrio proteolyticus]OOF26586.1 hypothetical protein BZJ19_05565 [Salinivibrio proteolyticus]